MNAHQIVEAVLFAADAPLTAEEIARADESLDEDAVERALQFLRAEYDDAERAFQVSELAEGYQILTRPEFAPYLERFDNVPRPARLSGPALETLAIIAYRQPLGRVEIEYIRGVGASGVIKTLQDRQLIDVVGRGEGLGRPLLYGTTKEFLEHFGFRSLEDLPRPEELPVVLRDRVPLGLDDDDEAPEEGGQEELPLDPDGDGSKAEDRTGEGAESAATVGSGDSEGDADAGGGTHEESEDPDDPEAELDGTWGLEADAALDDPTDAAVRDRSSDGGLDGPDADGPDADGSDDETGRG